MKVRHYSFEVPFGALAENLVNSNDATLAVAEHLRTPADLISFLNQHAIVAPPRLSVAQLEQTKRLRSQVRDLFEANTQ